MRVEQVTGAVAYHGEGPVWSDTWGGLRWVDMLAGDVLSLARDGSVDRHHVGTVAAALRPRRQGGAVIGVERGFALQAADGTLTCLDELWSSDEIRMNEGACDPDGRFYCGSMAYDQRAGAAKLYRLDPDGSVEAVLDGVTVSNGLDWSPDGSLAYYNDTATQRVDVFDYDRDRGLTARRPFVDVSPGQPDGLTVDSRGGVWVALSDAGAVHGYDPDGSLEVVIEVPARKVTACTFGGDRLDLLFITTSREGLEPDADPAAFHTTIPPSASTYALPRRLRDLAVRVYGFHGLSHAWVSARAAEQVPGGRRVLVAHVGAGASLCAVLDGRSVDTTMGFTPVDGLVMATRSGALDPGAVAWLAARTIENLGEVLERESGLLGLCGTADMREVIARADTGDGDARLALDVWWHRLARLCGAMAAALGGLDVVALTGGIGEHDAAVHAGLTQRLAWLGTGGTVPVLVVPAREDLQIAAETAQLLGSR